MDSYGPTVIVSVPVPDELCAVTVAVPCPTICAIPAVASANWMTPALLELHVAATMVPFTEALKVMAWPWLTARL